MAIMLARSEEVEAPVGRLRLHEGDGVLLVRLGAVGDVVRTLPCLARLREALPTVRLAWAVEPASVALLPGRPWLDEIFVFPRQSLHPARLLRQPLAGARALRKFVAEIIAFRPTLSIDFQGSAKSSLIGRLSRAPSRLGFDRTGAREASFLLNNIRVRPSSSFLNRVHKNLELLSPLALEPGPLEFPFGGTVPSEKVRRFLASLGDRVRIAVHAGTSSRQSHKQWPAENFAFLIGAMARQGWAPVLTWGPGERALIEAIQKQSGDSGIPTPPLDLGEMRQVIAGCSLFVGADTGPMHLAWSQGVPVVALFGSTDPRINGPLGEGHRIIAPSWHDPHFPPARGDRSAILQIKRETVLQEILTLVSSEATARSGIPIP